MLDRQTKLGFLGGGYVSQAALQSGSTLSAGTLHRDDGQTFPWQGLAPFAGAGIPAYINALSIPGAPRNVAGARDEAWVSGPVPTAYAGRTGALGSTSAWLVSDGVGKTFVVNLNGEVSRPGGPATWTASRSGDLPSGGITGVKTSANGKLALLYTGTASQAYPNTQNYACYRCDVTLDASGAEPAVSLNFTRIELGNIVTYTKTDPAGSLYAAIVGNQVVSTDFILHRYELIPCRQFDSLGHYLEAETMDCTCRLQTSGGLQLAEVVAHYEYWGGQDYRNVSLSVDVMGTTRAITGEAARYELGIDGGMTWSLINHSNRVSDLVKQVFDVIFAQSGGTLRVPLLDVASGARLVAAGQLAPTTVVQSSPSAKHIRAMSPDKVYLSDSAGDRGFFFT